MSIQDTISLELLNEAKTAFDTFDENKDGYIESRIIERALRALGFNPTTDEMTDIIRDTEGKLISFFSYLYIIYRLTRAVDTKQELLDALDIFDKTGSGKVQIDTLKKLMKSIRRPFTDDQINELCSDLTLDHGFVDCSEFIDKLLYP